MPVVLVTDAADVKFGMINDAMQAACTRPRTSTVRTRRGSRVLLEQPGACSPTSCSTGSRPADRVHREISRPTASSAPSASWKRVVVMTNACERARAGSRRHLQSVSRARREVRYLGGRKRRRGCARGLCLAAHARGARSRAQGYLRLQPRVQAAYFPRYALLDHVEFDKALQRQCRGAQIEDVWLPYFAVATDVDRAGQSLYVMRRGELWKAVRASGSIPAVLPPMFTDDGRMLVDGGVVDNIPLAPMKAIKSGPNLVVHFGVNPVEPYNVKYESIPGRRQLMTRMLNPFARGKLPRVPGPISVLRRCFGITRIRTCFQSRLWTSCSRRRHSRVRASSTSIATPRSTRRPIDGATFNSTSLRRRDTRR